MRPPSGTSCSHVFEYLWWKASLPRFLIVTRMLCFDLERLDKLAQMAGMVQWATLQAESLVREPSWKNKWEAITKGCGTSLLVQWLRICYAMQGTQVWSLRTKIPHVMEQLSPQEATNGTRSGACMPQLKSMCDAVKISRAATKIQ